jgi:hypothetical protein
MEKLERLEYMIAHYRQQMLLPTLTHLNLVLAYNFYEKHPNFFIHFRRFRFPCAAHDVYWPK